MRYITTRAIQYLPIVRLIIFKSLTGDRENRPELEVALVAVEKTGKEVPVGYTWEVKDIIPERGNKWQLSQPSLFDIDDLYHFVVKTRPRYWIKFIDFAIKPENKYDRIAAEND